MFFSAFLSVGVIAIESASLPPRALATPESDWLDLNETAKLVNFGSTGKESALRQYEKALTIARTFGNSDRHLVISLVHVGHTLRTMKQEARAEKLLLEATSLVSAMQPLDWEVATDTYAELASLYHQQGALGKEISAEEVAMRYCLRGSRPTSKRRLQQAESLVEALEKAKRYQDAAKLAEQTLAGVHYNMRYDSAPVLLLAYAGCLNQLGRFAECERVLARPVTQLKKKHEPTAIYSLLISTLALAAYHQNLYQKADALFTKAYACLKQLPSTADGDALLLVSMHWGKNYDKTQNYKRAEELYLEALKLAPRAQRPQYREELLDCLSSLYAKTGRKAESTRLLQDSQLPARSRKTKTSKKS